MINAGKRMGTIRVVADPETRLLATLSLANSLLPEDFAAWIDGSLFDLRGGPELMIFSKILMDRWQAEDPDGLLAWAEKNKNGAGDGLLQEWAAQDPQRLIEYFKTHRNDAKELEMLGRMAEQTPDLALSRLREMINTGMAPDMSQSAARLMEGLAKSPAALMAILDSLPPDLKFQAEGALSKRRMEESFPDEIRNLSERSDGWKIYSTFLNDSNERRTQLIDELPNLPAEWLRGIVAQSYNMIGASNAQKWLDTDLLVAGFTSGEIKSLHSSAMQEVASKDPAAVIDRLQEEDFEPYQRRNVLNSLFRHGDPEKLRPLLDQLTREEDRKIATEMLDKSGVPTEAVVQVKTPGELFANLDPKNQSHNNSYFSQIQNWDTDQLSAVAAAFKTLPDDQKQRASQAILDQTAVSTLALQGEAMHYLVENPTILKDVPSKGYEGLISKSSAYAARLSVQDPAAASAWVESLPAGDTKAWAQKNLIHNWQQYDPKAAAAWENGLPAAEREAIGKLSM